MGKVRNQFNAVAKPAPSKEKLGGRAAQDFNQEAKLRTYAQAHAKHLRIEGEKAHQQALAPLKGPAPTK